ncbi:MAG: hypothetical protein LBI42_01885 [Chitinispirillales bacterium]|nr:hypothetical protein [Chitinispirillales bacterium]
MKCETPILFIVFNRPQYTVKSFAAIRKAKPSKLYIAADGPRADKVGEKELCEQTRELILNSIDWECEVKILFQKKNLGCAVGVSTGISWFFKHEEQGIIIEDDVVANQSFFKYCSELLSKYKDNKNIWTIGGHNLQGISAIDKSYTFTKWFLCWGWATWRDRWKHFHLDVKNMDEKVYDSYTKNKHIRNNWVQAIRSQQNKLTTWDIPFFTIGLRCNALHVLPQKNMTKNIGSIGAHTIANNALVNTKTYKLSILKHPKNKKTNQTLLDELNIVYMEKCFLYPPKIQSERKIYLWGTGVFAENALFLIKRKYKITAFLDRQEMSEHLGYKVKRPEQILNGKNKNIFIFIVSTKYAGEMAKICKSYGLKKGVDFWSPV